MKRGRHRLRSFWVRHLKKHLEGVEIRQAADQSEAPAGQFMIQVRIKRWYMPVLLIRGLRDEAIPLHYWPLLFWRYYGSRKGSH